MPHTHYVNLDLSQIAESDVYLSITGLCCGQPVAAVVPKDKLPVTDVARRRYLAQALAMAHQGRHQPRQPMVGEQRVELE